MIIYTGVKKEKNDISKNVKQVRQQSCGGLSHITIFKRRSHYGESKIGISPEGYTEEEISNLKNGKVIVADDRNDFHHTKYARAMAAGHDGECCGEKTEDFEEDGDLSDEDTEN